MPATHPFMYRLTAMTLTALMGVVAASGASANAYLNWQHKAAPAQASYAQVSNAQAPQGAYGIPASPYGQVGNPYLQVLDWPNKGAHRTPTDAPPVSTPPVAFAVPRPTPRPQPVHVEPLRPQAPSSQVQRYQAPRPQAQSGPALRPSPMPSPAQQQSALRHEPEPMPVPEPVREPQPAPQVALAPVPSGGYGSQGYQVPATSKYAARIAAARAAQDQQTAQVQADAVIAAAKPPAAKPAPSQDVATAPAPVESMSQDMSLASQETDRVFIPGEQITDAMSQEPRRYSLHRQYGLRPDPIQLDPTPSGALLETRFDALEATDGADDNAETDDTPTTTP